MTVVTRTMKDPRKLLDRREAPHQEVLGSGRKLRERRSRNLMSLLKTPLFSVPLLLFVLFSVSSVQTRQSIDSASQTTGTAAKPEPQQSSPATGADGGSGQSAPAESEEDSLFARLLGYEVAGGKPAPPEVWWLKPARIASRLALAALLCAALAFRPRRSMRWLHRDPYVAQTQILLGVVASSLMMIVADNAARAFGIFAAASLVRFRTKIRDPKETTVLLINLAIGLATGVGRWEVAIILTVFVGALLWALEYQEATQVLRPMELKVRTSSVDATEQVLKEILDKHGFAAEVREIDRQDELNPLGKIAYYVSVSSEVSTDRLSEEILSADPHNIDSIEWHQKKSSSRVYR